jgi:RNA polymerase sigma-70 factor, ECF subfamily
MNAEVDKTGDRVAEPDKQQFIEMIEQHQHLIHKVCRFYCNSKEDRRDLFQEILLQLWKSIGSFRQEAGCSTWIYRIALNTAISSLRYRKRQPAEEPIGEKLNLAAEPKDELIEEELVRHLREAISTFSDADKGLLMLYLEEKSYDEIGIIFGMSTNRVGVKLHRIKAMLKERLNAREQRRG